MTTNTNFRARFMENNHAELTAGQITISSELAAFPFTNALNRFRSKVWKPSGYFLILSTAGNGLPVNNKLYINDGSDKTVTITAGEYTTPSALATQIQTDLNAASSNWTVTHNAISGTYQFVISHTGSATLRLSQLTDSIAETLGFKVVIDQTGTSFTAQEQRNHWPYEFCEFDLGYSAPIDFLGVISPLDEIFSFSNSSTVKLLGNNLPQWGAAPLEITLTRTDRGIFHFLDTVADSRYRFWRLQFEDTLNPNGPSGISLGNIYLGDYVTLETRGISNGVSHVDVDPSVMSISESGALYFDEKTIYRTFDNLSIGLINKDNRDVLENMYLKLGKRTPFYVSLDPQTNISNSLQDLTRYVIFSSEPKFEHIINDIYNMSFSLREVF